MGYENFKEDIIEAIGEENVDKALILVADSYEVEDKGFPKDMLNKVYRLKDIINYLDYRYDSGFGGQECHDIQVWVNEQIFYIHEYDGSTSIYSQPTKPPHKPHNIGKQGTEEK